MTHTKTFVLSSTLSDTQPHLAFSSVTFSYETVAHSKGRIQGHLSHFPLRWFSVHQEGGDFQSLVYLLISFINLSLSHPLCHSSLSATLIPYQPTGHPSPCCLSRQIHHPPICLMLPMVWDDLLRVPLVSSTGWTGQKGNQKITGKCKKITSFPTEGILFISLHGY